MQELNRKFISGIAIALGAMSFLITGSDAADEKNGEALYHEYGCVYCHGYYGHGGGAGGPRILAPSPYNLEAFRVFVRTPQRLMPPYPADLLSDEKLRRIYDFVQSIEESPSQDDIPALIEMRERYRKLTR
jgi:mono/diheme cytochrome c family protein